MRAALALAAGGATLSFVLDAPSAGRWTGFTLIVCAIACLMVGVWRFAHIARPIG